MNVQLVESLAEIVHSLTKEEKSLLAQKVKQDLEEPLPENGDIASATLRERPFYETATPQQRAQAFLEWAESHRGKNHPSLSDEAISRESIYGERG